MMVRQVSVDLSDLIGKPFEDFGRGPNTYDCYGLALEVAKRLGKMLPDYGSVCSDHIKVIMRKVAEYRTNFDQVQKPSVGDIVLIRRIPGDGDHIGIITGRNQFIHTTKEDGVHFMKLDHPLIRNRIAGFYRYREKDVELSKIRNPFDLQEKTSIFISCPRDFNQLLQDQNINPDSIVVFRNGLLISDLSETIWPGDQIHLYPQIHNMDALKAVSLLALAVVSFYVVGPAVSANLATAGWGPTAAGITGGLTAGAMVTAGGLIINGILTRPAKVDSLSDESQSPTYGWTNVGNSKAEGLAIPVVYGNVASTPQVISQYIEIDDNGDQWSHTLLAVHEGPTNNIPDENSILINNESLLVLESDSYIVTATDGSADPDTDALVKFEQLHQMRYFNKVLIGPTGEENTKVLLNFNGSNGSTTILDESEFSNTWTCHNTASLSTASPWDGTAALNLETSGDFITLNNDSSFNIRNSDFDIEVWFKQDSLTDSGICNQRWLYHTGGDWEQWYWGFFYISGSLKFQYFKRTSLDGISWNYTTGANYSKSVSISIDTWTHLRVARYGTRLCFWLDGERLAEGTFTTISGIPRGNDTQGIGYAYYYNGASVVTEYGNCRLDSFRLSIGALLYDFEYDFTPPTSESSTITTAYYTTQSFVDKISMFFEAPQGLYDLQGDGTLASKDVDVVIYYKNTNGNWVENNETFTEASRYPSFFQVDYTLPTRDNYQIKIVRTTPQSESTTVSDVINLVAIDEVLDEFLHYPYLQCVSVSLKAQSKVNTNIPVMKVISNVSEITVPNLDGIGTAIVDSTNNGYTALDILTNDIYGIGLEAGDYIHESSWQDWIDWCAGTVNGYQRCQFNMIFDASYDLSKAIQHVENCGRARLINRGTQISAIIENPSSKVYVYSEGNIKPGSSKLRFLPQSERSDAVEISFKDKDLNWEDNKAFAPSSNYETLNRVPRITRMTIPGINNYEQALREAILRQQISSGIKRSVEFETGIEGLRSVSGDIIEFQSGGNSLSAGGRIAHDDAYNDTYTDTTVYIDREISLDQATFSGNCKIIIRNPDDTLSETNITGPWDTLTNAFTLSSSLTMYRFSPYIIRKANVTNILYRINGIRRSSEQDVVITALQYVESSFYHANYGGGSVAI